MDYIQTIRQVNFAKLWSAQILSQVAQYLLNFALIILVYDLTAGSKFGSFSVSLVVLSFTIPSILFAPAAGTYVDYWDRKKVLVFANLARTILALIYIVSLDHLFIILLLTFLTSTVTQFFVPAEASTIPKVVDKQHLLTANSLFVFTLYTSFVIGFSASGPVVKLLGQEGPFMAVGLMFALATLLVAFLPPQPRERPAEKLPKPEIIKQIRHNWEIIRSNKDRYYAVMQMAVTQGMVFILITLAPALSLALLKVPLTEASHFIVVPVGLGMVTGVILINYLSKRLSKLTVIQACLIAGSFTLIMIGLTGQLYRTVNGDPLATTSSITYIIAGLMFLLGVVNAMVSASAQTLVQETTSDEDRGKVFGSLNMIVNIAATIPVFVVGLLADLISVTKVLVILGVLLLIYATLLFWKYGFFARVVNKIQRPSKN